MDDLIKKDLELQRMQHALDWYNGYCEQLQTMDRVVCANLSAADRLDPTVLSVVRKELFPDFASSEYIPPKDLKPLLGVDAVDASRTSELILRIARIEEEIHACKQDPLFLQMMEAMGGELNELDV